MSTFYIYTSHAVQLESESLANLGNFPRQRTGVPNCLYSQKRRSEVQLQKNISHNNTRRDAVEQNKC